MKNWKTAAALGVTLLALGGLATWDEWKTKDEEKQKEVSNLLTSLKVDQIKSFKFMNAGDAETDGDKIAATKPTDPSKLVNVSASLVEGKWQITAPISVPAEQQVIQDLLKNILEYKYESEVGTGKDNWVKFGLNTPRRSIELEANDGSKTTIFVGINSPVGFSLYAATDKSDKIFVGSQHIATTMAKTLFDFREKKILAIAPSDITAVTLSTPETKALALNKTNDQWQITLPEAAEADNVQVGNFLDDVTGVKAIEFVEKPSKDVLASFASGKHLIKVELTKGSGPADVILMAAIGKDFYVKLASDPQIMKVSEDLKNKVSKSLNDFRNKKIFDFQSSQTEGVEIDGKSYKRVKDEWYLSEDAQKFGPDGAFPGKVEEKPLPRSHIRGLLVDLEYAKAESIHIAGSEVAKGLPKAPKHRINVIFGTSAAREPIIISIWQAGDNPEMIYLQTSSKKDVTFKAKASIIASMNDAPKLPAEDASFQPSTDSPPIAQ